MIAVCISHTHHEWARIGKRTEHGRGIRQKCTEAGSTQHRTSREIRRWCTTMTADVRPNTEQNDKYVTENTYYIKAISIIHRQQ